MTREEMIAELEKTPEPQGPSREEMIAELEKTEKPVSLGTRAKEAVGYGLKGLDYAGGMVRTGAAGLAGQATSDDFEKALKGSAPSISEYLERSGMSDMGKMSDLAPFLFSKDPNSLRPTPGGSFDPTVRGAIGMAADMALDPLTYLGAGPGKALLAKMGKVGSAAETVLNPLEKGLQSGGKTVYKSSPIMKAADAVNERFNKGAASDILFENRIAGTGRQVATKAEDLAEATGQKRNAVLRQADDAGGILDMNQAMSPAEEFIHKVRASRDPQLLPVADALEERVAQYKGLQAREAQTIPGKTTLTEAGAEIIPDQVIPAVRGVKPSEGSGFKSSLYNDTGNSTWDTLRKTPQGDLGNKTLARGLDQETSRAAERVLPGSGAQIDDLNDTWGALLTPRKALEAEALKGEKKNFITSVDGLTAGLTHGNPIVLGAKKLADLLKTNWTHTHGGMLMHDAGKIPLLDEVARREMINKNSDWEKLRKGKVK